MVALEVGPGRVRFSRAGRSGAGCGVGGGLSACSRIRYITHPNARVCICTCALIFIRCTRGRSSYRTHTICDDHLCFYRFINTGGSRDTHGTHGHTDHTDEPHNHPADSPTHTHDRGEGGARPHSADRTPRPTQKRPPPRPSEPAAPPAAPLPPTIVSDRLIGPLQRKG